MKRYLISFIAFLSITTNCNGQVPKVGDSMKIEIANWNLEWFGKTGFGPDDEFLQMANVLDVIKKSDIDIWSFCEVSNKTFFDSMMVHLPEYGYTVCNYAPEQKTAVIFKKDHFRLVSSKLLGATNPDSFTTGRFPFLVTLKPLIPMGIDTLNLIALHLKSNIGTSSEKLNAYNSRLRSGEWLKMYLDKEQVNRHCIVLGDWNDDLDESIYNGLPSPFASMLDSDFKYKFITRKFTDNHIGTTTGYPDAIDHQLISLVLEKYFLQNSTTLFRLDQYISSYSNTTSDHYPVYSIFNRNGSSVYKNINLDKFYLYPNPSQGKISITGTDMYEISGIKMYDINGKCVLELSNAGDGTIDVSELPSGLYKVAISTRHSQFSQLLQVLH